MFVEHKELGEAVPGKVGRMKLSEAIRKGAVLHGFQVGPMWCGCAIGAAHFALTGKRFNPPSMDFGQVVERWAAKFGYDPEVARYAEGIYNVSQSHAQTISWLESQGF